MLFLSCEIISSTFQWFGFREVVCRQNFKEIKLESLDLVAAASLKTTQQPKFIHAIVRYFIYALPQNHWCSLLYRHAKYKQRKIKKWLVWALMWFVGSSWSSITLSAPVHVSLVYMHRKGDKQEEMQKIPFCHSILWFFLQAWETRSQHAATGSLNHNQQFSLQITNVPASGPAGGLTFLRSGTSRLAERVW